MNKYKAEIRVPTAQYAYFSVWIEDTPQGIVDAHEELKTLYKASQGATGLPDKEFNAATDRYFNEGKMDADVYTRMSKDQMDKIQWAKRSFNRTNSKIK